MQRGAGRPWGPRASLWCCSVPWLPAEGNGHFVWFCGCFHSVWGGRARGCPAPELEDSPTAGRGGWRQRRGGGPTCRPPGPPHSSEEVSPAGSTPARPAALHPRGRLTCPPSLDVSAGRAQGSGDPRGGRQANSVTLRSLAWGPGPCSPAVRPPSTSEQDTGQTGHRVVPTGARSPHPGPAPWRGENPSLLLCQVSALPAAQEEICWPG